MNKDQVARKANFCIDGIENGIYEGYTLGESWNGFACPYFPREVAKKLASDINDHPISKGWYNEEKDQIHINLQPEDGEDMVEVYEPIPLTTEDGSVVDTFPIGSFGWIWDEYSDEEIKQIKEDNQ